MDKKIKEGRFEALRKDRVNPANKFLYIGAAIALLGVFLGGARTNGSFSTFTIVCFVIACVFITYSGVIVVARKEAPRPGLPSIKGIGAVISGVFIILTAGIGGLIILVSFLMELIQK